MVDTMTGYMLAQAAQARGAKARVFDWDKAARLIRERQPSEAQAGLAEDMEWTAGPIYRRGSAVPADETYVYLSSIWATPVLVLDGNEIECWRHKNEAPGWDSGTYWPESARRILNGDDEASGSTE